jgi:hypothetical protein
MRPSPKLLLLSLLLTAVGTLGGWAIGFKLGDEQAALSFMHVGVSIAAALFLLQALLYLVSATRLLHQVLFGACLCLSILWFMLCLLLPLFWVPVFGSGIKLLVGLFACIFWIASLTQAFGQFRRKWDEYGAGSLTRHYNRTAGVVEWDKVIGSMKLSAALYLPGVPSRGTHYAAMLLILAMLLGMNFRKTFPMFSALAWGLSLSIVLSVFVQMAGFAFAQAFKIRQIEQHTGKRLRAARVD